LPVAAGLVLLLGGPVRAQDEARSVIDKAIKATGGAERLAKIKAARSKFKGTGEFEGATATLTGESLLQFPGQMKFEAAAEIQGQTVPIIFVLNGDKVWLQVLGATTELKDEELEDAKEGLHAERVQTLVPLLEDKTFTLTPLGEVKLNMRDAVGVTVTCKGHKDVNLYFDKATGLLSKTERRALNDAQQEVTEETFFSDYKKIDGVNVPMKHLVHHDGKKYLELEVTEYSFVDRIDDAEFARPGESGEDLVSVCENCLKIHGFAETTLLQAQPTRLQSNRCESPFPSPTGVLSHKTVGVTAYERARMSSVSNPSSRQ
jgi:outer membrane lipoprotein-sorting protein